MHHQYANLPREKCLYVGKCSISYPESAEFSATCVTCMPAQIRTTVKKKPVLVIPTENSPCTR